MSWWGYDYRSDPEPEKKKEPNEEFPNWDQRVCIHSWKPIVLLISTVHDCSKCGIKKEEYEEWQQNRKT